VRVWVCGVRGSTAAPGSAFAGYGGHTSCIAIAHDGELPRLILDAGTGIRRVSDLFESTLGLLEDRPFEGSIVLGHLHWDHTQGLPFFGAANRPGSKVKLFVPAQGDTKDVIEGFMSPPYFPITPDELLGSWSFFALEAGKTDIDGFSVLALDVPHSAGRTFGLRISDGMSSIAYISDHCPTKLGDGPEGLGEYHESALALCRDCDVVFHDGQYTDEELPARASFGHASSGYAVGLAAAAGARQLLLFHHDPARTDRQIDEMVASYADESIAVGAAREGMIIDLP
jgi:phosphoribosyl 1,2-cyclic phosphodiesterase